jgi:hypothetical protein
MHHLDTENAHSAVSALNACRKDVKIEPAADNSGKEKNPSCRTATFRSGSGSE